MLLLVSGLQAQYALKTTLAQQSYYTQNANGDQYIAEYLGQGQLHLYDLADLDHPLFDVDLPIPAQYQFDSLHMVGFTLINNVDFGFAFTVKNADDSTQLIICNKLGDVQFSARQANHLKVWTFGSQFKLVYQKKANNGAQTVVMDPQYKVEATYNTEHLVLGQDEDVALPSFTNIRLAHTSSDSTVLVYNANHQLLNEYPFQVPDSLVLQSVQAIFPKGFINSEQDLGFALQYAGDGNANRGLMEFRTVDTVVSSIPDAYGLNLRYKPNGDLLNLRVSPKLWKVYEIKPNTQTNTLHFLFDSRSGMEHNRFFNQSAALDADGEKAITYDYFLKAINNLQVDLGLKANEKLLDWAIYGKGQTNGFEEDQEVYLLKQKANGDGVVEVRNNLGESLFTRDKATKLEVSNTHINRKRWQMLITIPGKGTEVYEYDFSIPAFKRVSPVNKAVDVDYTSVTFTWEPAKNTSEYTIQGYMDTSDFSGNFWFQRIEDTFYTIDDYFEPNTTYYWRVQARNSVAMQEQFGFFVFNTYDTNKLLAPKLRSPANQSQNLATSVNFSWSNIPTVDGFEMQYSTQQNMASATTQTVGDTQTTVGNLAYGTTYYWRVRATKDNRNSAWSEVYGFTTVEEGQIGAPVLISPTEGEENIVVDELILRWSAVPEADDYTYQVALNPAFDNYIAGSPDSTFAIPVGINAQTTYYWRVRANQDNRSSEWSSVGQFSTGKISSRHTVDLPNPTIYPNPAHNNVTIEWPMSEDAELEIRNITGQLVKTAEIAGFATQQVDLYALPKGTYLLMFNWQGGQVQRKLVVE